MKTRLILSIIAISILCAARGFAQEKDPAIYLKLYGGYSLLGPGSDYPPEFNAYVSGIGQTGNYSTKGRLGEGFNFGFGLEKDINPVLIGGIDLNYLSGKKNSSYFYTNKGVLFYYSAEETDIPSFEPTTRTLSTTHSVLSVIPNISFKVYHQPRYFIYTKVGIIVTAQTKLHTTGRDTITTDNPANNDAGTYNFQYKYGLNLGLQAAAGVKFNITNRIKGFVELTGNFLAVSPTSGTTTAYETNRLANQNYIFMFNVPKYLTATKGNYGLAIQSHSTSGITSTDYFSQNSESITQHINSIVLNIGVEIPIK